MTKKNARAPSSRYREPFDGDRDFVVVRPMRVGGASLGYGDVVDKLALTPRRLRQLYDQRWLSMAPEARRCGVPRRRLRRRQLEAAE